jgi:hypothetical protein
MAVVAAVEHIHQHQAQVVLAAVEQVEMKVHLLTELLAQRTLAAVAVVVV